MTARTKQEAALKRGVDELQTRLELELELRNRPRALANSRREYVAFCLRVYGKIEKAMRWKQ